MVGQSLGHYKIIEKLGAGGMGEVYRAEDTTLKRQVALKVLPPELAESQERLERFQREAETLAALDHPNIVTIHTVEEAEGVHFLTMQLVEGQRLSELIPKGGMPLERIFDIAIPLADALTVAHEKGVIHRDLKPANVMLSDEGRVKVLDFGLAKLRQQATSIEATALPTEPLTEEGEILGTVPFMSPEQLEGKEIDSRSDIFSLGVILYEMTTGERPFNGDTTASLIMSIGRDTPPEVDTLRADLPHHLGRIVAHCLDKEPRRRYQSVLDVRNELEALRKELESGPKATTGKRLPLVPTRRSRLGRWLVSGALLVALAIAAGRFFERETGPGAPTGGKISSVAVLPFTDLSPQKDQEYFTDGMTEELLQVLGRIEGLKVPSRTSVFALKGKDLGIDQIGERLGVEAVVEGSVRKAGNQLRIAAQLVQVSDGFQIWSETYNRDFESVFAVQEEIAQSIADALQVSLSPEAERAHQLGGTTNPEAYEFYLRGEQYRQGAEMEHREYACQMYERAIQLDPAYALAHTRLAWCRVWLHEWSGGEGDHLDTAEKASARALELAPELAAAHAARAAYLGIVGEPEAAMKGYDEAIRLDPEDAWSYFDYGFFLYHQGQLERAAELWEKAVALEPEWTLIRLLPQVYRSLGREADLEAANRRLLEVAERHLGLNPDDLGYRIAAAGALIELGEKERALEWMEPVTRLGTNDPGLLYNMACFYSIAGEADLAIQALERAFEAGDRDIDWWQQDSDLDNIRDDPRFQALLERYGQEAG